MMKSKCYASQIIPDESLKEAADRTGCGVELVDFSMASVLDAPEAHLASWKERLLTIRAPHVSVHGPFLDLNTTSWDPLIASATMTRFEQGYRAAKILGADTIVFHSCFVPNFNFLQGWSERVIDFYERFLDGKDDSIRVVMENVMDPVPDGFAEVCEGIRHPAFGICLDIGHAHCYAKVPVAEWLRTLSPWIRHIHLHDNDGTRDAHLALGQGTIPLADIAGLIPENVTFTAECNSAADVLETFETLSRYTHI